MHEQARRNNMCHSRILLRNLNKFYEEMSFLSYHVTEYTNECQEQRTFTTVTGMHPDYHLVTIVQSDYMAEVISEHDIPPHYGGDWAHDVDLDEYDPELDEPTKSARDRSALEAAGAMAFALARRKAEEAGVIRPAVRASIETGDALTPSP
jgi:hypothetical protein